MSLWSILERARRLYPDQVAVVDGGLRLTYAEVGASVDALAAHLRRDGVGPGDRLATFLPNSHDHLSAYFAAAGLGAVLVPLNTRLAAPELAAILSHSGARAVIAAPPIAEPLLTALEAPTPVTSVWWTGTGGVSSAAIRSHVVPGETAADSFTPAPSRMDSVAHLYYTSGTTGRPKGVMLTHRNVWVHALGTIAELGLSDRDRWAHVAPMFHLADAWATFALTWVGGRHVMFPQFDPALVLAGLEREAVTLTNLVPTMLNLMVKHEARSRHDYRSLRMILSGGAPIAPSVIREIINTFGCEYVQTYGMTETSPYLTLSLLSERLRRRDRAEQFRFRAKTGRPFIGVELRVVGDDGSPVAADDREVGEIEVRGETVTPGYWNDPEATRAAFRDGWLRTGDLAVIDPEGYVTIVDRRKDMIITGGEKVYSTEVEHVLYRHPAVLEAAVYGLPHPVWGEQVTAAVVLRPDQPATEEDLMTFCRPQLAGYKLPRRIRFLAELPRTGSGKILKRALLLEG
jgi:acyl-CoA synthetase (AMP-forming)/AMP-acid ligase II